MKKNCHRDKKLDDLLGQYVRIYFRNGYVKEGFLTFVPRFCAEFNYKKPLSYYVDNLAFRKSAVKQIEKVNGFMNY